MSCLVGDQQKVIHHKVYKVDREREFVGYRKENIETQGPVGLVDGIDYER